MRAATRTGRGGLSRRATAQGLWRILSVLAVAALVCVPVLGCGASQSGGSSSTATFDAIKRSAESYLTPAGKELAQGKTDGASIYSVDASLDTEGKTIGGKEQVLFTNRTTGDLSEVVFRVYASEAGTGESRKPTVIGGATANGKKTQAALDGSYMSVSVPGGIKPHGQAVVSFSFSEPVPKAGQEQADALYAYDGGTYNLGYFLPTVVTNTGGAWDERPIPWEGDANYYDASYYSVSLKVPGGYVVAAPGVESSSGDTHTFVAGPLRDFEAQISNKYRSAQRQVGSTTVASYYFGTDSGAGAEALDAGSKSLRVFSENFGPYPYTRLNVCEAPMEAYGMEYSGQVQIASFLYEDQADAADLEVTVAHEVGHQWWALGVGSDTIGMPWLDESLTGYCEVLYSRWLEEEASAQESLAELADNYNSARAEGVPDGPVDQAVSAFASGDQYTALVYGKGAFFFDALWKALGPAAFEKSLSDYYRKNVFLNATTEDLLAPFRANSGGSGTVDQLYQRWITQAHGDEDMPRP